jgi:cell division protease FtsH
VNFVLVRLLMPGAEGPVTVPYTLFKEEVTKGNVQAIHSRADVITGKIQVTGHVPAAERKGSSTKRVTPSDERAAVQRLRARPRR